MDGGIALAVISTLYQPVCKVQPRPMTDLRDVLTELGLVAYLYKFIDQGFDTWHAVLDITESDLGAKLGHRRKLQREIANWRGLSVDMALGTHMDTGSTACYSQNAGGVIEAAEGSDSGTHKMKRRYRRHPKPDKHAPLRPLSAYMIFSNNMRKKHKAKSLSFTEMARLIGEQWQSLLDAEKALYEQQASTAKETYSNELAQYKKMDRYLEHVQYRAQFKARQEPQSNTFLPPFH